jgi:hypothetical protein
MHFFLRIILLVVLMGFSATAKAQTVSLVEHVRIPGNLDFCGEPVKHSQDVAERFEKEMLLTLWDRPQVILWLKRSPRYLPLIAAQLKRNGMPDDLKYLAIAESALRPHAGSSKGAIGYWQLLAQTARNYGLVVDEFVDERREINASTGAAVKYLQFLHRKFGSWTLAVAGYNMGEEGLAAEILEQKMRDYYKLYLPLETQRFIFRILAVKLIVENPDKYGFHLESQDYYAPIRFDRISMDCFQETPIRLVAEAAGSHFKIIKDLNPHLRGHYIQEGHHSINLPEGRSVGFQDKFETLVAAYNADRQQRIYIVQSGDSLSSIADKFNVPLAALLIWNRMSLSRTIHPGDRLVIHNGQLQKIEP